MTILAQEIIYKVSPIGIIIILSCAVIGFSFGFAGIELDKPKLFVIGVISCIMIFVLAAYDSTSHSTLLNKPNKIQYTVEITNDNTIQQVHGFGNRNASSEEGMTEFVKEWAKKRKLNISNFNKVR